MKLTSLRNLTAGSIAGFGLLVGSTNPALAVPVTGGYVDDARCDPIPNQILTHELGTINTFPLNEAVIINSVSPATFTVCVPDDGIANDWIVDITNISSIAYKNLFFVADLGMNIGNADGTMTDLVNAPGVPTDAFRIDGTVTLGVNNNLLGESGIVDEIFSPGESWRFTVSNFTSFPGAPPFPVVIQTPGKFAGSDPIVIPPINTASILATPVPEPATWGMLGLAACGLLLRRPRAART